MRFAARFPASAFLLLGLSAMAGAQTSAAPTAAGDTTFWNYQGKTGPLGWDKLNPAFEACSKGHEQSPIDIRGAHLNKELKPIEFHYIGGPVTLENNGHTVVVHVDPGSYMVANGVRYNLIEFDFHHPSEEAIKGKFADMSIHLLHRSADGKLAVVAVRLIEDRGQGSAALATLWQHLPQKVGTIDKITDMFNPGGLLPDDRGYWTYTGSLTTPPCTEGVEWFVFEQELTVSRQQWQAFANLYKVNTRELQDPHGRRIEADE